MQSTIPPDIRRFLASVASVPQLEALMLLRQDEDRAWTAEQLAARLYIGGPLAKELLARLQSAGLVSSEGDSPGAYRFTPNEELRDLALRVGEFYAKNLVAVTQLIHARDTRSAQQFADAFRLRKEP